MIAIRSQGDNEAESGDEKGEAFLFKEAQTCLMDETRDADQSER